MPSGDQALFLIAEVFRRVGGFPELPIMEDLELILQPQVIHSFVFFLPGLIM